MKSPHSHENYHLTSEDIHHHSVSNYNGIKVTVDELYRLRSDAMHLTASPADAVNSLFPGAYQAVFHGRGLEFDEVRAYQWGDDYRTVDWRVTARTGQMHTKLFHQEREHSLFLLVDCSPAMHFGSQVQFKWVLAARIAAIFSWLACENNDRIGLILFGHQSRCEILPPRMGQPSLLKIFKIFAAQGKSIQQDKSFDSNKKSQAVSTLADALNVLHKVGQSGALILLLSDFSGLDKKAKQQLAYLCRHHDVAAIKLSDPLERALPDKGIFAISNGYQSSIINCHQKGLQDNYAAVYSETLQQQTKIFASYAVRLLNMGTEQNLIEQLRLALQPLSAISRKV